MSLNSLPDLPVEVWRDIIQYLRNVPRAVPAISLTSRHLRQVCRPFLFERIVFDGFSGLGRAFSLFLFFDRNPEAREWVKELRISNWSIVGPGMPARGLDASAVAMEKAFRMLRSLRALEIFKTYVTPGMWAHIGGCTQLRRLSFQPAYVSPDVEDDCFEESQLEEIKLKNAENGSSIPYQAFMLMYLESLKTIRIDVWLLTGAGNFLKEEENPSQNLKVLDIFSEGTSLRMENEYFAAMEEVLAQYPDIAHLSTPDTMDVRPVQTLPNNVATNLTSFQGRPTNVGLFCPHMTLESLSLSAVAAFQLKEEYLTAGPFQLRSLSLHGVGWDDRTLGLIERHCSQLEELKVYAFTMTRMTETDIPDLPNLKSVTLMCRHTPDGSWLEVKAPSSAGWRDNEQRLIEQIWAPQLPELTQARFNNVFSWKHFGPADGWGRIEGRDLDVTLVRGEFKRQRQL
ncbi:hypothetical protein FS837_008813 [Tulasnella sp. UAMH 9824]|nr:hypothetical protein FS837_008813 [Tulasnella sp. UAMH 9824]